MCGSTALDWCKTRTKNLSSTQCFGMPRGFSHVDANGSPPPRGFRRLGSSASAPQLVCHLPALGGSSIVNGGSTSSIQARCAKAMFRPGPNLRAPAADRALLQPDCKQVDKALGPAKLTKQGQFVPRLHLGSTSDTGSLLGTVTTDFGSTMKTEPVAQPQTDWKEYYKNRAAALLAQ